MFFDLYTIDILLPPSTQQYNKFAYDEPLIEFSSIRTKPHKFRSRQIDTRSAADGGPPL